MQAGHSLSSMGCIFALDKNHTKAYPEKPVIE